MSTTAVRPPRKRPAPSERDQEIYVAYQTTGLTQVELAGKYKLTQCRVSQILRRVEKWRSSLQPQAAEGAGGQRTEREQQRLDRWLERERNEAILREALRQFRQPQQIKTTKQGPRGEEVTVRELPPNVQCLKIAQRANEQLFRREQLGPLPVAAADAEERQLIMFQELLKLRQAAQAAGHVRSDSTPYSFVFHLLRAARGEAPQYGDEDPGLIELAERLLWKQLQAGSVCWTEPASVVDDPSAVQILPGGRDLGEAVAISSTCAAAAELPQVAEPSEVAGENSRDQIVHSPIAAEGRSTRSCPEPDLVPATRDDVLRRQLHMQKLEQLKDARRRGLPVMFHFDSADGPLPPPYYSLDGVEY